MGLFETARRIYREVNLILDVAILAFLIYRAYKLLSKTQAIQLIRGAGFLALIFALAYVLKLGTLLWLLNILAPGILIAVAIVFQPELRKIIIQLGLAEIFRPDNKPHLGQLEAVITAAEILSEQRRGMLIIFPRRTNIKSIIDTGTRINGEISSTLIVTVFQFDGPLHDGAMVIQNGRIAAAGCFLPLSEQRDIRKSFGTRHRAALGMSEQSDAVVLIVSEETGALSLAYESRIYYDLSPAEIHIKLSNLLDRPARGGAGESGDESPAHTDGTGKFNAGRGAASGKAKIPPVPGVAKKEDVVVIH
ncbi:MAG: diadenylate cyclase CdaA [Spirochaetaceae bacterium]|jgi:diadenylate cyclase|nr:diadenylate cyclase CdaA [Spirochaetaceae bacterium]